VTYNTKKDPSINRSLSQSSRVQASLPISVNVQDFFRGKRLRQRHSTRISRSHTFLQTVLKVYNISDCSAIHPRMFSYFGTRERRQRPLHLEHALTNARDHCSSPSIRDPMYHSRLFRPSHLHARHTFCSNSSHNTAEVRSIHHVPALRANSYQSLNHWVYASDIACYETVGIHLTPERFI
jgi:hypothetical protein